jgi:hypothetical protein
MPDVAITTPGLRPRPPRLCLKALPRDGYHTGTNLPQA